MSDYQKIFKLLNNDYQVSLMKDTRFKTKYNYITESLDKVFKLEKINNDFDFYNLEVLYEGFVNKSLFEKKYEKVRRELVDLWDTLSNTEKNKFINNELRKIKINFKSFVHNDVIIWIPFFDELLNSLYDHEMAVFELKQYFKLYNSFSERLIDLKYYNHLPFLNGFASVECLLYNDSKLVLYNDLLGKIYLIEDYKQVLEISLKSLRDKELIEKIAKLMFEKEYGELIELLLERNEYTKKTVKKVNKIK